MSILQSIQFWARAIKFHSGVKNTRASTYCILLLDFFASSLQALQERIFSFRKFQSVFLFIVYASHLLLVSFLNIEILVHNSVVLSFTILSNPESKNKLESAKHVASNDDTLRWISTNSSWVFLFYLSDSFLQCSQVSRKRCKIKFFKM